MGHSRLAARSRTAHNPVTVRTVGAPRDRRGGLLADRRTAAAPGHYAAPATATDRQGDQMADAGRAALRVGALANVVAAAGLSAAFAFSQRLFGSADESVHLDYAYEVWKGRLPVF